MKLSRDITILFHFFFDQCVPPFLRDTRWFMYVPYKILFGKKMHWLYEFKDKFNNLTDDEIIEIYKEIGDIPILHRDTDINKKCITEIEKNISGNSVLDIACGRAYMSGRLSEKYKITASDFVIEEEVKKKYPRVKFKEADITKLPFKNREFDTVLCAHTLEHVRDIQTAINELRRVAKKRLIIIVPKQRPYKYTFDLHIHFFPYIHSFLKLMGKTRTLQECRIVGGDIFYIENMEVSKNVSQKKPKI